MDKDFVEDTFGEIGYLNKYKGYSKTDLSCVLAALVAQIEEAEKLGWKDVRVKFNSTIESYEDYPGDVEVKILGQREKTQEELAYDNEQMKVQREASKLGITFYEAKILDDLKKRGKI